MAKSDLKSAWVPGEAAFQRLLTWLDAGTYSQGERYLEIATDRQFFARRKLPAPDDLGRGLESCGRRLEEPARSTISCPPAPIHCRSVRVARVGETTPCLSQPVSEPRPKRVHAGATPRRIARHEEVSALLATLRSRSDLILDYNVRIPHAEGRKKSSLSLGEGSESLAIRVPIAHPLKCVRACSPSKDNAKFVSQVNMSFQSDNP